MKKILITIILIAVHFIAKSQITIYSNNEPPKTDLEKKIAKFSYKIDSTIIAEKKNMKKEIDAIHEQQKSKTISEEQAEKQKAIIAEKYAVIIDEKTQSFHTELEEIIKKRVELSVKNSNSTDLDSTINKLKKWKVKNTRFELNTRFAMSKVGLVEENESALKMDNQDFSFAKSGVTELSLILNYKLGKNYQESPYSLNFGLGLLWNTFWLKDNTKYIDEDVNGNVVFNTFYKELDKSKIRGTYLTVPLELRYDFLRDKVRKDGKVYKDDGFSVTVGTYFGYRIISKRILIYDDGGKEKEKTSGDFNQSPVIYGVSLGVNYKSIGLFVRRDMNEYFSNYNSDFNQRIEFGIRLGF